MKRKIIAAVCAAVMLIPLTIPMLSVNADYKESDLKTAVTSAIKWKSDNDSAFYDPGLNSANLYVTALRRLGRDYDYDSYLNQLNGVVAGYGAEHNASDMQRTVLAIIASGGEPRSIAGRDMVADSTYFRDATAPLDKEGVNGLSWAIIALDSKDYETPDWAMKNRNQIITNMLSYQNTDGSFSGDVYATASAITALARYMETSGSYTVTRYQTGETYELSPKNAVNNAVKYLEDTQTKDSDWGDLISTAMAVIALDTLGIDAGKDNRFIARNGSAVDGLMSYQNRDGGFANDGNKSDGEATSYALCALTSHLRRLQGKTALFYMNTNDTVNIDPTPAPTAAPTATPRTSSATATARPTTRPTVTPRVTQAPTNTMRPTRTVAPKATTNPNASPSPTPTPTPRPTRRPDLVGPVEMPGPMQPTDPPEILNGGEGDTKSNAPVAPIVAGLIALLFIGAAAVFVYLYRSGRLPQLMSKKKKPQEQYKAKQHRRTEEHRSFEKREKYKQRLRYKK